MQNTFAVLLLAGAVGVVACGQNAVEAADQESKRARRPNVLIVLADDQGWGDLSVHGNTNLRTPHIDSLARDGALFERFYVCPLCAPTRAEFLTGRYFSRGGVHGVTTGAERLNLDERTIAETFRAAGYATGAFGKWHNGSQYPYHPNGRGFDEYYGFTSGHWGQYFDPPLEHNGKPVRGKGFIIDDLTDRAMAFIEQHKDRPFFCYVPYNTPHSPFQVPDPYWEKFKDAPLPMRAEKPKQENLAATRCALAMCENIDWNVGRMLRKLDELKLADNTIVVYFSDNGPNTWRWNGGMKGRKGTTDEGGVRVPCLVRWPGRIQPQTKVTRIAGAIDFLPTLGSMAGIAVRSKKPLDGIDLSPLLLGTAKDWSARMIFSRQGGSVSVRTDEYRLAGDGALFDMRTDPGQRRDVREQQPKVAERLAAAVARWKKDVAGGPAADDRPFPVGYREFPTTPLPARDGVPAGNVRRSAKAPNCSYFTNWRSTDDKITWDIDVHTAGDYAAVVYYTCPKEDAGATIELSLRESSGKTGTGSEPSRERAKPGASGEVPVPVFPSVRGKVTEGFDPPFSDGVDRVPRDGESHVKEFRPLRLGVLRLDKGRGALVLRAVDVPGRQVADVRMVELTLVERAPTMD
jgi:arylsulfatase A-like enzyme